MISTYDASINLKSSRNSETASMSKNTNTNVNTNAEVSRVSEAAKDLNSVNNREEEDLIDI